MTTDTAALRDELLTVIEARQAASIPDDPTGSAILAAHQRKRDADTALADLVGANWPTILAALSADPADTRPKPCCATCGKDVAEILCPTCAKWWSDNPPPVEPADGLREARVKALEALNIPHDIQEQVLAMGRAEWGATEAQSADEHLADFAKTLRITREHFNLEDVPVQMHGLYLEATETVLCHTGTSPNSPGNAQALTGAWNWLFDQCAAIRALQPEGKQ